MQSTCTQTHPCLTQKEKGCYSLVRRRTESQQQVCVDHTPIWTGESRQERF